MTAVDTPVAILYGQPVTALPEGLYVPPHALRVLLEAFQGPFDLLWYLIRKHRIDVRDIPVAALTDQYLAYVAAIEALDLDLAADYLAMAAYLIELKARSLLRRSTAEDDHEPDPRVQLQSRLENYERARAAAQALEALPRAGRDWYWSQGIETPQIAPPGPLPPTVLQLARAWWEVLARAEKRRPHPVETEPLTYERVAAELIARLQGRGAAATLFELLPEDWDRRYLAAAFFVVLELARTRAIVLTQAEPLAPIFVAWHHD